MQQWLERGGLGKQGGTVCLSLVALQLVQSSMRSGRLSLCAPGWGPAHTQVAVEVRCSPSRRLACWNRRCWAFACPFLSMGGICPCPSGSSAGAPKAHPAGVGLTLTTEGKLFLEWSLNVACCSSFQGCEGHAGSHGISQLDPSWLFGRKPARVPQGDSGHRTGGQIPVLRVQEHLAAAVPSPVRPSLLLLLLEENSKVSLACFA